jgi:hypothetical protein
MNRAMRRDQLAAAVQTLLEGTPLPAEKHELFDYAHRQGPPGELLAAIGAIADTRYARLDDVGEAVAARQPSFARPEAQEPRPESGAVPGGDSYLDPAPEPGAIRDAPTILEYEQTLVREPAPLGEGIPEKGSSDDAPGA